MSSTSSRIDEARRRRPDRTEVVRAGHLFGHHGRDPGPHRLQWREPVPLGERHVGEGPGAAVHPGEDAVAEDAGEDDAVGGPGGRPAQGPTRPVRRPPAATGPASEARTWPNARTRRSTFLRGSSVPTVRRNSPARPAAGAGRRPPRHRVRQEIGAARHHGDPALLDAHAARSAATRRDGTSSAASEPLARASAASCQRSPAPGRRLGVALPGHVVDRHDQRPLLERRSRGDARDTECTTSNPGGTRTSPWSQARVKSRPGSRDTARAARTGRAGRPRPPGGRLARSATSTPSPSAAAMARPPSRPGRRCRCRRERAGGVARRRGAPDRRRAQPRPAAASR